MIYKVGHGSLTHSVTLLIDDDDDDATADADDGRRIKHPLRWCGKVKW